MATDEEIDNNKKKKEIAALMLLWKLALEERFKPHLQRFFNQIANDISAVWIATGRIPSLDPFHAELVTLLRNQYRAIANKFEDEYLKRIDDAEVIKLIGNNSQADNRIIEYINRHSVKQADYILNTTRKDLEEIAKNAVSQLAIEGIETTPENIAKRIKENFKDTTAGRIDNIALTETQITSERVKYIEAEEIDKILASSGIRKRSNKEWVSILDEVTRPWHVEADGQIRPISEPYIVGGQLLMIPGDTSLGASMSNIAGCRCTSVSTLEDVTF